jgi:Homeodomain-like domain
VGPFQAPGVRVRKHLEGVARQMLAWELVVEAEALSKQGWTISAIARHLGVTRVTVRQYLSGERTPGLRASSAPDPFAEYVEYCRLRLAADPLSAARSKGPARRGFCHDYGTT